MYDIAAYRKSEKLKENIRLLGEMYLLSAEDKMSMSRNSYAQAISRLGKEIGNYPASRVRELFNAMCAELRDVRRFLRSPPDQRASLLQDITDRGLTRARTSVNMMFPRYNFAVVSSPHPSFDPKRSYYGDNVVGIPKSWLRSVHEKDLTQVAGSDSNCFILSARPRKSIMLETEYFSVFALRVTRKEIIFEEGWVARANGISAYSDELKKAQSLLNRRVRAKIMREFLGE
jgi:hypothetical protein